VLLGAGAMAALRARLFRLLLWLRLLRWSLLLAVLVVVVVVGLEGLLAQFFLSLVDVRIQFVPVFPDRELSVVVDWDVDLPVASWLVVYVVELGHVGVPQSCLCTHPLVRIEMQ